MKQKTQGKYSLPAGLFSNTSTLLTSLNRKAPAQPLFPSSRSQVKFYPNTSQASHTHRMELSPPAKMANFSIEGSGTKAKHKQARSILSLLELTKKTSAMTEKAHETQDALDVSITIKSSSEQEQRNVLKRLEGIQKQMEGTKLSELSFNQLLQWQRSLSDSCKQLIQLGEGTRQGNSKVFDYKEPATSQTAEILSKLLVEEKKNRLLVEEQTSKIISSQEQEIKTLFAQNEKLRLLEIKLLSAGVQ